jgi:tetratricopeptide (TPR) repeat protein
MRRGLIVAFAVFVGGPTARAGVIFGPSGHAPVRRDALLGNVLGRGPGPDRAGPDRDVTPALESFKARDYAACLGALERMAKDDRGLPPAKVLLARLHLADGQLRECRDVLEGVSVSLAAEPELFFTFGTLAYAEGRVTDAEVHYEKAAALAGPAGWPEERKRSFAQQCRSGRVAVSRRRGDWASVRDHCTAWLGLDPKNVRARQELAHAYLELGQGERAYAELRTAAASDPLRTSPAVLMGWMTLNRGDPAKANEWMDEAVRSTPRDPRVLLARAAFHLYRGRADRALADVDSASAHQPDPASIDIMRGLIALQRKEFDRAVGYLEGYLRAVPGDFQATNALALAAAELEDESMRARALSLAEGNARLFPGASEARTTLGWVYFRLGRPDDADRALRAALAGGASPDAAYYLARVSHARGHVEEARRLLDAALGFPQDFRLRPDAEGWLARWNENRPVDPQVTTQPRP